MVLMRGCLARAEIGKWDQRRTVGLGWNGSVHEESDEL